MILFSNQIFLILILIIIGEIVIGQRVLSRCKKKMVSNFFNEFVASHRLQNHH